MKIKCKDSKKILKKVTVLNGFHAVYPKEPLFEKLCKNHKEVVSLYNLMPKSQILDYVQLDEEALPENPYPESMFKKPTHEQYKKCAELLKANGMTIDAFSGAMGRLAWNSCLKALTTNKERIVKVRED